MRTRRKKGRNEKGLGTLSQRGKAGNWYLRIKVDGQVHTHRTGTSDLEKAKIERDRFLKTLRVEAPAGSAARVTVSELLDDYKDHLKGEGKKDAEGIGQVIDANIRPAFVGRLASSVTTQDGKNYRTARLAEGVVDSTVNKELKHLIAAFNLGKRHTPPKVSDVPYLPIVAVDNVRMGFLEVPEYRRFLGSLPASLKLFLVLAYHGGCRKGELIRLKWTQLRRRQGYIELLKTKNGHDRNFPIYGDMAEWLDKQDAIHKAECPDTPYILFWHREDAVKTAKRKAGERLNTFYKSWHSTAKRTGVTGILPHDMRRSAVRNMVQECGMTEGQAQTISGHLTRDVFDRYNIVSLKGILESGKKMDAWMKAATAKAESEEKIRPFTVEPEPLTTKQRVRELYVMQGKSVPEIMQELDIAESTVHYHISGDKWGRKKASTPLEVQA